jgi:hypothetical protein
MLAVILPDLYLTDQLEEVDVTVLGYQMMG